MKTICLIGFMGSGKTTIGLALANHMGRAWVDLDTYIEEVEGRTIATIFQLEGEAYFRQQESRSLEKVLLESGRVVSTGGGIVMDEQNRQLLTMGHSIYLSYEFDTLYQRIAGDEKRPLATSYEALKERFQNRQTFYESAATHIVACEGKSINCVVEEILQYIETVE